ncbi:MAG TPA: hypothetical protein VF317_11880, partial [Dermatophilaceae bacterium]
MVVIADNATVNSAALGDEVVGEQHDQSANPVSTDVAAERIANLLRETRTRPVAGRKKEPLGVLLTANVELVGLRGQAVLVTWRIYQAGGTTALFGKWLGTTAAYRLVAGTD